MRLNRLSHGGKLKTVSDKNYTVNSKLVISDADKLCAIKTILCLKKEHQTFRDNFVESSQII